MLLMNGWILCEKLNEEEEKSYLNYCVSYKFGGNIADLFENHFIN